MSDDSSRAVDLIATLIDRGYDRAFGATLNTITQSTRSGIVAQRLKELDTESQRLMEAGDKLTSDNPVLRALLADVQDVLRRDSALLNASGTDVQESGVIAGQQISKQLALRGVADDVLLQIGIRWNTPDPEAVNSLVGYTTSSAWREAMQKYGEDAYKVIENQALRGMLEGWSPRRTASQIRRATETMPAYHANNIARTLQLQSYRTATAINHQANASIAVGQRRIGTLDSRICLCCLALHGEEMRVGDVVLDHHLGRCTSVLIVQGYPPPNITTGPQWFNSLSESEQLNIAGAGALEALQSGKATLRDFVQTYDDPVFGEMVRQGSIERAIGGR
jgi:hypothetical protein